MKILLLVLTFVAAVSPQARTVTPPPAPEPVEKVRDIIQAPKPPKWRKYYRIDYNQIAANVVNLKPVASIDVKIFPNKDVIGGREFDELADQLQKELATFIVQIQLKISYVQPQYVREGTGKYYSTPIRVNTFCTNGFCSSTARGGEVYEQTKQTYKGERVLMSREWKNY